MATITTTKKPQGSKILPCTCVSEYQDKKYGAGNRVHNACKIGTGIAYRCSVCETKHT